MSRHPESSEPRPRRSRSEWRQIITEQEASGLSIAAFCREHDLCPQTLYGWRSRLARTEPAPPIAFVKVESSEETPVTDALAPAGELSVEFPSGATLRCPADRLGELVTALTKEADRC